MSNKECVPSKTEDLSLTFFNMITEINESKILTKHISYECKCRKRNSNLKWNNNKCRFKCRKHHICEKIIFGILVHVIAEKVNI